MAGKAVSPVDSAQASFSALISAAAELNAASDELTNAIVPLEQALATLNLGISAWVKISGHTDEYGEFWQRDIGYDRIKGQWGIAIRALSGNESQPEDSSSEEWLFTEAARWRRIEAVAKLPELLEQLIKKATSTAAVLRKKAAETKELTNAIVAMMPKEGKR